MCVIALLVIVTRHGSVFHTMACATNVHSPPCLVFWSSPRILICFPAIFGACEGRARARSTCVGRPHDLSAYARDGPRTLR